MWVDCAGKQIYYEVRGQGKALIILNGLMMSTKSWSPFMQELGQKHKLVLMDFFDQGQSARLEQQYTQGIQVEAVKAVMQAVGESSYDVCGISYGAHVALQLVLKYPELIRRLVLANVADHTSESLRDLGRSWNYAAVTPEAYYLATIPVIYSASFYSKRQVWMEQRKQLIMSLFEDLAFRQAMQRLTLSAESYDVRSQVCQISQPCLLLAAEHDIITPPADQYRLAQSMPKAKIVLLPNCGHASMYEQPELFLTLVLGFFALSGRSAYV